MRNQNASTGEDQGSIPHHLRKVSAHLSTVGVLEKTGLGSIFKLLVEH
jgi:hypothetical protein